MIPYRARRVLWRITQVLLALAVVAAVILLCWFMWLSRYIVYTRDGAKLNFSLSMEFAPGQTAVATNPLPSVQVHYGEETKPEIEVSTELERFSGYYVTLSDLRNDFEAVKQQLEELPERSTILFEVKDLQSYFYYSSNVGFRSEKFDVTLLDDLIPELKAKGHYLIARIPAFQEYDYILEDERERVPYGLPRKGGDGSLWLDTSGPCYWMNPASEGTLSYLIQIVTEIRIMGFNEVVFADFRFPETDKIKFDDDKMETLNAAATTLVKTCSTETFCVSFTRTSPDLKLPEGRTRLYLTGVSAAQAASMAAQSGFSDPKLHVVFITEVSDTRYDAYCVLRPIDSAH